MKVYCEHGALTPTLQALQRAGIGSWGGWCLSLAPYVTGTGGRDGATAAGGCSCCCHGRPRAKTLGRGGPFNSGDVSLAHDWTDRFVGKVSRYIVVFWVASRRSSPLTML
jgi:hypothetical protein